LSCGFVGELTLVFGVIPSLSTILAALSFIKHLVAKSKAKTHSLPSEPLFPLTILPSLELEV
jgi:hypothetical protein